MLEPYNTEIYVDKESVNALIECIQLQLKKSRDYQNPVSTVKQADYYLRGVDTLYDSIWGKMLRVKSLLDAAKDGQDAPNFESIEDSFKDLINYASFGVAYLRGGIEGQEVHRDMFNRPHSYEDQEEGPYESE